MYKVLEYLLVRILVFVLLLIPFRLRAWCTENMGALFFFITRKYRDLILKHLKQAFPDQSDEWCIQIAKNNFRYMGRLIAEIIQTPYLNEKFMKNWIIIRPDSKKHHDIFKNAGIAILGHLGNWEWHGFVAGHLAGRDIYTLVKRHTNFWSNRFLEKSRNKANMRLIYIDQNPFVIIKYIRRGDFIAFTADQNARGNGEFFPFLGKPASTFLGPATIARNCNAPVYLVWSYHDEKKRLVFEYEELEKPQIKSTEYEKWESEFTRLWVRKLEEKVRKHPSDYLWAHNRWKTQPIKMQMKPGHG